MSPKDVENPFLGLGPARLPISPLEKLKIKEVDLSKFHMITYFLEFSTATSLNGYRIKACSFILVRVEGIEPPMAY